MSYSPAARIDDNAHSWKELSAPADATRLGYDTSHATLDFVLPSPQIGDVMSYSTIGKSHSQVLATRNPMTFLRSSG